MKNFTLDNTTPEEVALLKLARRYTEDANLALDVADLYGSDSPLTALAVDLANRTTSALLDAAKALTAGDYDKGYDAGYDAGYQDGYDNGVSDARDEF